MSQSIVKTERNTFALMGLAALLITNSHLEKLYPRSWLAADGLLGNLFFFFLAGYGVAISQRQRPDALGPFFLRRLQRIYPSLWPAVGLAVLCGLPGLVWARPFDWLWNLIWPTDYRFVAQILFLYPLVWWIARMREQVAWGWVIGLGILWLGMWGWHLGHPSGVDLPLGKLPNYFWWTYFTWATCLGAVWGFGGEKHRGAMGWWGLSIITMMYFGLKLELALRIWTTPERAPTMLFGGLLQMMALGIVVLTIGNLTSLNKVLVKAGLKSGLEMVGKFSLQLYLLHPSLVWTITRTHWRWELKVAGLYVSALALAWILWKATSLLSVKAKR